MVRSPTLSLTRASSLALALLLLSAPHAFAAGDATKGADVFKRCTICHNAESGGGNRIGPNLFGVVGRPAGSVSGYSYSSAMKSSSVPCARMSLPPLNLNGVKSLSVTSKIFATSSMRARYAAGLNFNGS